MTSHRSRRRRRTRTGHRRSSSGGLRRPRTGTAPPRRRRGRRRRTGRRCQPARPTAWPAAKPKAPSLPGTRPAGPARRGRCPARSEALVGIGAPGCRPTLNSSGRWPPSWVALAGIARPAAGPAAGDQGCGPASSTLPGRNASSGACATLSNDLDGPVGRPGDPRRRPHTAPRRAPRARGCGGHGAPTARSGGRPQRPARRPGAIFWIGPLAPSPDARRTAQRRRCACGSRRRPVNRAEQVAAALRSARHGPNTPTLVDLRGQGPVACAVAPPQGARGRAPN